MLLSSPANSEDTKPTVASTLLVTIVASVAGTALALGLVFMVMRR